MLICDNLEKFGYRLAVNWPEEWRFRFSGLEPVPQLWWRTWLENHIGQEGVDWDWDIKHQNTRIVEFVFKRKADCLLFQLTWG